MIRYNRDKHHRPFGNAHGRRSIRLQGYDYSQAGLYFITICTKDGEHLFGEITDGKMVLNAFGKIADNEWLKTGEIRDNVELSEYVIMPNHIHGIIVLNTVGAYGNTPLLPNTLRSNKPVFKSPSKTIGAIIRGYKSAVTKQINVLRNTPGMRIWQRNYYEHIIRNEKSYYRIAEYILNNPLNWREDEYFQER